MQSDISRQWAFLTPFVLFFQAEDGIRDIGVTGVQTCALPILIVLVVAATATHTFERHDQPDAFGSLPNALWWAVVTLTTTGYGDVVPHTVGGKMVGALVMVSGIAVLALMTGVLATGFSEEERRREYLRVWDQVTKVPIFTALGTVTLSEIVSKLRTRHYSARIVVVRRDEPGDSMFFISECEVEVRLPHA